ncbi:MAG: hypothetical protein RIS47_766, partial [Bacteroidota bacterium]
MNAIKITVVFFILAVSFTACDKNEPAETITDIKPRPITETSSPYVSQVFEYAPAPGQFVNSSIGTSVAAQSIIGKKGLVTLGGFGGYIVTGFDHSIMNTADADFIVYGNAFNGSSEPGIVAVSVDSNQNGMPDDPWYELRGEDHNNPLTLPVYQISYQYAEAGQNVGWADNQQKTGYVYANTYHTQNYYPESANKLPISRTGTRLPDNITLVGTIYRGNSLGKGYADNYSAEYSTYQGNTFDISNAVDAQGNSVT